MVLLYRALFRKIKLSRLNPKLSKNEPGCASWTWFIFSRENRLKIVTAQLRCSFYTLFVSPLLLFLFPLSPLLSFCFPPGSTRKNREENRSCHSIGPCWLVLTARGAQMLHFPWWQRFEKWKKISKTDLLQSERIRNWLTYTQSQRTSTWATDSGPRGHLW